MIKNKEKHLSNLIVDEIGNRILLMIIFGCIGSFAMYCLGLRVTDSGFRAQGLWFRA